MTAGQGSIAILVGRLGCSSMWMSKRKKDPRTSCCNCFQQLVQILLAYSVVRFESRVWSHHSNGGISSKSARLSRASKTESKRYRETPTRSMDIELRL